jgi:hypothetical protein
MELRTAVSFGSGTTVFSKPPMTDWSRKRGVMST